MTTKEIIKIILVFERIKGNPALMNTYQIEVLAEQIDRRLEAMSRPEGLNSGRIYDTISEVLAMYGVRL